MYGCLYVCMFDVCLSVFMFVRSCLRMFAFVRKGVCVYVCVRACL